MNRWRKNKRGFATVLAVTSLLLVGISITGLMRRFSNEARRTQEDVDRAQLRQMVIAGGMSKPDMPVSLPNILSGVKAQVAVRSENAIVTVTAKFNGRHEQFAFKEAK